MILRYWTKPSLYLLVTAPGLPFNMWLKACLERHWTNFFFSVWRLKVNYNLFYGNGYHSKFRTLVEKSCSTGERTSAASCSMSSKQYALNSLTTWQSVLQFPYVIVFTKYNMNNNTKSCTKCTYNISIYLYQQDIILDHRFHNVLRLCKLCVLFKH